MDEDVQKRLITILSGVIAHVIADRIADRYLDVPERRGVRDDLKEAFLKGAFRVASTVLASIIIREVVSKRW